MEANRAAFGYAKVASLFFVSLLGPLLHKSCLLTHSPQLGKRLLLLRSRHRPEPDGFLEFGYLCYD